MDAIEKKICENLAQNGASVIGDSAVSKAKFESLAARGFVRMSEGVYGPLRVATGETVATLTETGVIALKAA